MPVHRLLNQFAKPVQIPDIALTVPEPRAVSRVPTIHLPAAAIALRGETAQHLEHADRLPAVARAAEMQQVGAEKRRRGENAARRSRLRDLRVFAFLPVLDSVTEHSVTPGRQTMDGETNGVELLRRGLRFARHLLVDAGSPALRAEVLSIKGHERTATVEALPRRSRWT